MKGDEGGGIQHLPKLANSEKYLAPSIIQLYKLPVPVATSCHSVRSDDILTYFTKLFTPSTYNYLRESKRLINNTSTKMAQA